MVPGKDGNAEAETPVGNPAGDASANSSRTPPVARNSGANNLELPSARRRTRWAFPGAGPFRRFDDARQAVFVKAGAGTEIERRGGGAGHRYALLGHMGDDSGGIVVEPCLVELTAPSDALPAFRHDGMEFLCMLEGELQYRHGDALFTMQPGDSLFFNADVAHGPEVLSTLPIRYLSVAAFPRSRRDRGL